MESNTRKKDVPAPAAASPGTGPVKVFRLDEVSVSVFRRDRTFEDQSIAYFSVSFSRSYQTAKGERKYTKNFDAEDLGKVMTVAKQASDYIDSERGLTTAIGED